MADCSCSPGRQVLKERPAGSSLLRGDLGQPDDRLDRLDLAEEGSKVAEPVMSPMLEQARRLRGHPPVTRIRTLTPVVHLVTDAVDDLGVLFVLLLLGREALAFVED